MFIDIDYGKRTQTAKLHIAKPNKQILSPVNQKFGDKLSLKLGNINELNFSIPHFILDESTGERVRNKQTNKIKEKMLIRAMVGTYEEWFVVDSIEEDASDSDTFNVITYSLGYELKGKRVSNFETESMNAVEVASEILFNSGWKIKEIDPMFNAMSRSFESGSDSNALTCILQWAETFGGLLVWDTKKREISLKDIKQNGSFRGMIVNYGKFLNSVKRSRTTEEMTTRMWIYGSEDLTIHSVNPTGEGYIEDFTFFMHPFSRDVNRNVVKGSYFMSDELCHAILDHEILVLANAPEINSINLELNEKRTLLTTEESILETLNLELDTILQLLDIAQSTENEAFIEQRKTERDLKQSEIDAQKVTVISIEANITSLNNQLIILRNNIENQANFTVDLLDELNLFIIESTWRDDRYIDVDELYADGIVKFNEIREPKVIIEVSMDNLMNILEEQYYWDKLVMGDLIKVKYPQMDIEYMAKIIEINYDLELGEVDLVIANTKDLLSETEKLVQLLYNSKSASTMVQNNKYKWDKINAIEKEVSQLLTNEWDATKNKIIAGVNNSIEVGNRGIIIRNPDFPNEVVIMQSGVIALSKDGGETWKTAINPSGIVAERLIGQIIAGQELLITNSTGTFTMDNNGAIFDVGSFTVRSGSGNNLVDRWEVFSDFVDQYTDDNLITAFEKKMLGIKWEEMARRYVSNVSKIEIYYEEEELQFVTNYYNSYDNLYNYLFVTLHGDKAMLEPSNLGNTTQIFSADFTSKFRAYDTALIELEEQLLLTAKESTDRAITDVEKEIDDLRDKIVYKTEIHSSKGNIFLNGEISTTLYALVYKGKEDITNTLPNSSFKWKKTDKDGVVNVIWTNLHNGVGSIIQVNATDVFRKATFWCDIEIIATP